MPSLSVQSCVVHTCAITHVTQVARLLPPGDDMHPLCCQWTWPCYSRCYGHQRKVAEAASRGTVDLWSSTACKWQNIYVLVLIIYIQFIILQNYFLAALQMCHVILSIHNSYRTYRCKLSSMEDVFESQAASNEPFLKHIATASAWDHTPLCM